MCKHENMKPYYYGPLYPDIIDQVSLGAMYYGGMNKYSDSPDYFCRSCLDDIYL